MTIKSTVLAVWPVVPLVGTWIEIAHILIFLRSLYVVPLVGTWIEITNLDGGRERLAASFPLWERGLKLSWSWRIV